MMVKTKNWMMGFLSLVVATTFITIQFNGDDSQFQINLTKTLTKFYVNESNNWVLAGTEYNVLYNGTKVASGKGQVLGANNDSQFVYLGRKTNYIEGMQIIDTYKFDPNSQDVEQFPISHEIRIVNASGEKFIYRVKDLKQISPDGDLNGTSHSFGHNMRVKWVEGNIGSTLKKGVLEITYIIPNNDFILYNRLFDPLPEDSLKDKNDMTINCKSVEKIVDYYNVSYEIIFYNYTEINNQTFEEVTHFLNYSNPIQTPIYKVVCSKNNVNSVILKNNKEIFYKNHYTYSIKDNVITVKDLHNGGSWDDRDLDSCWNPGVPCTETKLDTLEIVKEFKDVYVEVEKIE